MIGVGNRYHVDANITNANITNANITNANITNANITNANITNANITANVPGLKGRGLDAVRIHCVK